MSYILKQKLPNSNLNPITIPLAKDNVRVGRKTVSELSQYPQISREHAEFLKTTFGTLFVRDLNSSNGLFVNGNRVGTSLYQLKIGDIIGFGIPHVEDSNGFICMLCAKCDPSIVKHEVIEISDEEELQEFTFASCSKHSNPVPQEENQFYFASTRCEVEQPHESTIQSTSNFNRADEIQTSKVSDTSSSSKSCDSVLYIDSVCENESEQNFDVRDRVEHASSTFQINSSAQTNPFVVKLQDCCIRLVRCDSDDFDWPTDVQNPYKKHKPDCLSLDNSPLIYKRKHIKKLSSDSDCSSEGTAMLPFHRNQNGQLNDNASRNTFVQPENKKRKISSERNFSSQSNEHLKLHDDNQVNFSRRSSKSSLKNGIGKPITMTVQQEDASKPGMSIDNEINYSQVEEILIISDDESYLDFNSSQNYVHIKEEPPDIDEDADNPEEIFREIFDAEESECNLSGSRSQTFIQNESPSIESIESIRAFVNSTEKKSAKGIQINNETIPCDLEMECIEERDSDDTTESQNLCTDKIPVPIENLSNVCSTSEVKNKNIGSTLTSTLNKGKGIKKSTGRTILTDPKPMQNSRPRKIRGREEGFREQKRYREPAQSSPMEKAEMSKKSKNTNSVNAQRNVSSTKEVIKIGNLSSDLKDYKIPHKSRIQDAKSRTDSKSVNQSKNASGSSQSNSVNLKKKAAPVKTRPEKFGSRMAFLTDGAQIKPRKGKTPPKRTDLPNQLKPSKSTSSIENQSDISKNILPSTSLQNRVEPFVPNDKSTSVVQHNFKSATATVNTRDPRLNKLNSLSGQEVEKVKSPQASCSSTNVPPVRMTDVRRPSAEVRPLSRADSTGRERTRLNSHTMIRNLINLKCVWLQEQAKNKAPPPQVSKGAADLPLYFQSYLTYVNSFSPMIMLEIWDYMYSESKEVFKSNKAMNKFYFAILSYASKSDWIELKCESVVAEKLSYSPKEGSLVILELKDGSKISPLFGYIFRHRVDKIDATFLQSSVWQNLPKEWLANAKRFTYHVYIKKKELSFVFGSLMKANGICYIRSKLRLADALGNLNNSPLVDDIIRPEKHTFFLDYAAASPTREYTSGQMKVINGIHAMIENPNLGAKIVLVQGPPGTGKTRTIIGILEKLVQNCNSVKKIFMTAPSNAAIDEIGCRLIELNEKAGMRGGKLKFVRIGVEKQIHEKMIPYFLDEKVKDARRQTFKDDHKWKEKKLHDLKKEMSQYEKSVPNYLSKDKLKRLREEYNALKEQVPLNKLDYHAEILIKQNILKDCHIVLSTLNSCGQSIMLRTFKLNSNIQFLCCIVDEATQCTELEILQPLMFGINKLILVGDHMQLPATVTSKLATDYGFERSMFERFHMFFEKHSRKSPVYTLTEQFRMHSKICAFPSKYFYHNKLITEPIIDIKYKDFPLNQYFVLDILNSQETNDFSSKVNCTEASVIANICKCLLEVLDSTSSIGIITPYQGQRTLYLEALHQNPNYRDIEINTIDSFQGREKDVIIFSCVRANSQSGGIGFLISRNRLNVAITRARKCLIICCHVASLHMYPDWRTLFDDAKKRNSYIIVQSPDHVPSIFDSCIKKKPALPICRTR